MLTICLIKFGNSTIRVSGRLLEGPSEFLGNSHGFEEWWALCVVILLDLLAIVVDGVAKSGVSIPLWEVVVVVTTFSW